MARDRALSRRSHVTEAGILSLMLILIFALMTALTGGKLLGIGSLEGMAFQMPLLGLLTLAQMLPMITGGIDLSIVSIANLSGVIAAIILTRWHISFAPWLAIPAALGVALAVGAANGILVSIMGVSPIIATLASMILVQGVAFVVTKGTVLSGFPPQFLVISTGSLLGIPVPFLIFAACLALVSVLLQRTPFGISVYMLGSNLTATLFSGVNTRAVLFRTYLISAALAGIAALVMISRFNAAQADFGSSFLLLTVLISVLGGIDPAGGSGTVRELLIAVVILQVIATGFNFVGLSSHLANALWGTILILAIAFRRMLRG